MQRTISAAIFALLVSLVAASAQQGLATSPNPIKGRDDPRIVALRERISHALKLGDPKVALEVAEEAATLVRPFIESGDSASATAVYEEAIGLSGPPAPWGHELDGHPTIAFLSGIYCMYNFCWDLSPESEARVLAEVAPLNTRVRELMAAGDHDAALRVAEQAEKTVEGPWGRAVREEAMLNMAQLLCEYFERCEDAAYRFGGVVEFRQAELGQESPDLAEALLMQAYALRRAYGDPYEEARAAIARADEILSKKGLSDDPHFVQLRTRAQSPLPEKPDEYVEIERSAAKEAVSAEEAVAAYYAAVDQANRGELYESTFAFARAVTLMRQTPGVSREDRWIGLLTFGTVLNMVERSPRAERVLEEAAQILDELKSRDANMLIPTYRQLATAYRRNGKEKERAAAWAKAEQAASTPQLDETGEQAMARADQLRSQERFGEASDAYELACDLIEKESGQVSEGFARCLYGLSTVSAEPQVRLSLLEKAVSLRELVLGTGSPVLEMAVLELRSLYLAEGRLEAAEPLFREEVAIWQKSGRAASSPAYSGILYNAAAFQFRLGLYRRSEAGLEMAVDAARAASGPDFNDETADYLRMLGLVRSQLGKNAEAIQALEAGTERFRSAYQGSAEAALNAIGNMTTGFESPTTIPRFGSREAIDLLVSLYFAETANAVVRDRAFVAAQAAASSQAAAALTLLSVRNSKYPRVADLVREYQDLALESKRLQPIRVDPVEDQQDFLRRSEDSRPRLAEIDRRRSDIMSALHAMGELTDHSGRPFPSMADVAAELGDQALLYFYDAEPRFGDRATYVWTITGDRQSWVRLPLTPDGIRSRSNELRNLLGVGGGTRGAVSILPGGNRPAQFIEKAAKLYGSLLAPALVGVDSTEIIVIPSASMGTLPLHMLVASLPGPQVADNEIFRTADWVVRHRSIAVAPGVSAFMDMRRGAPVTTDANRMAYFGVGDPALSGDVANSLLARHDRRCEDVVAAVVERRGEVRGFDAFFSGSAADVWAVNSLAPLPDSLDELCASARALGAGRDDLLTGSAATQQALDRLNEDGTLRRARVIHFATHGLVSGDIEGVAEPALVLTPGLANDPSNDGLLTASEITRYKLDADWIVLSACNTAAGDQPRAESLSGLARAFFFAGARAVMVSHWPVYSDAAVEISTKTVRNAAGDPKMSKAQALRAAMLAAIAKGGRHADPAYWAPFVLVGDDRPVVAAR